MLVSHDRALLRSVCDEFWLVGRGRVEPFEGDLDDYQRYLLEEARRLRERAAADKTTPATASAPAADSSAGPKAAPPLVNPAELRRLQAQRRQQLADKTRPLKRALEQVEQRLHTLGGEQAGLEQRLATPLPPADIAEAGRRLKAVGEELAALEEEWLRLSAEIEDIEQAAAG
jgi:ATP-binding cassette subfamily F protein 3